MRFLLGVLVGYTIRGKHRLLIKVLVTLLVVCVVFSAVVLPAIALLALRLDVQRERRSRPVQTKVPALKELTYEDAEKKVHAAHLNIRLLATRYDPVVQPGLVMDQTPAPGEEVAVGYSVGVTISKKDFAGPGPTPWFEELAKDPDSEVRKCAAYAIGFHQAPAPVRSRADTRRDLLHDEPR